MKSAQVVTWLSPDTKCGKTGIIVGISSPTGMPSQVHHSGVSLTESSREVQIFLQLLRVLAFFRNLTHGHLRSFSVKKRGHLLDHVYHILTIDRWIDR
jgi:hypothetical protein